MDEDGDGALSLQELYSGVFWCFRAAMVGLDDCRAPFAHVDEIEIWSSELVVGLGQHELDW